MSGGSLRYGFSHVENLAHDIDEKIAEGCVKFKGNELSKEEQKLLLKEITQLSADLKSLAERAMHFEWWLSGDYGDRDYLNSLPKIVPKKRKKKEESLKEVTETIGGIFHKVKAMADAALEECKPGVEYIIKNKIKDQNAIDHLLDDLMDLVQAGANKELFFKLLNYYKDIDEEGYNFHLNFYNEMMQ